MLVGMKLHGAHIDKIKGEISDKMMPGTTRDLPPIVINCKNQKKLDHKQEQQSYRYIVAQSAAR